MDERRAALSKGGREPLGRCARDIRRADPRVRAARDSPPAGARRLRLPILVNSIGGSTVDAMAMGRLIRANHLAVAVAMTKIDPCAPGAKDCGPARGEAVSFGAECASACPLLLAGGVERYASPLAFIGVHQITQVVRNEIVFAALRRTSSREAIPMIVRPRPKHAMAA
jgi:hypothetical protein